MASQHHSHVIYSLPITACRALQEHKLKGTILKLPLPSGELINLKHRPLLISYAFQFVPYTDYSTV